MIGKRRGTIGRWTKGLVCALVLIGISGCAAHFSPRTIRDEITRQRGIDPLSVFEINLGRFTTMLLKSALTVEGGNVPFQGLSELQLSVFEVPSAGGPALDVTLFDVRGWEPVFRMLDGQKSAMILVRSNTKLPWSEPSPEDTFGDLVVVGAGEKQVIYARLQGRLRGDLPRVLGEVFQSEGPDEVQRVLTRLSEGQ